MKHVPILIYVDEWLQNSQGPEEYAHAYKTTSEYDETTVEYVRKDIFDKLLIENYTLKDKLQMYQDLFKKGPQK